MTYRIILFIAINFTALLLGGFFTGSGVSSDWYATIEKAPWTPPGWTFGVAWTTIMVLFSFYMAYSWPVVDNKKLLIGLFALQWVLNVGWNPVFFYYHNALAGLFVILALTLLIAFILVKFWAVLQLKSLLLLPYLLWLIIATSLNAYIFIKN